MLFQRKSNFSLLSPIFLYHNCSFSYLIYFSMKKLILTIISLFFLFTGTIESTVAGWLMSSSASLTQTKIYFENLDRVQTYTVYWVDFTGVEKKYNTLAPGVSYTQDTYIWHVWIVRDSMGNAEAIYTSTYSWDVVSVGKAFVPAPQEPIIPEVSTMPFLSSGMGIYRIISKPTLFSKYELCSSGSKMRAKNGRRIIKIQTNTMGILYASEVTKEAENQIWLTNVYSPKERRYYDRSEHVVVQCS